MVVILVVAFVIITIVAVCLKRRHDAKMARLYERAPVGSNTALFSNHAGDSSLPGRVALGPPGKASDAYYMSPGSTDDSSVSGMGTPVSRGMGMTPLSSSTRYSPMPQRQPYAGPNDLEIREMSR